CEALAPKELTVAPGAIELYATGWQGQLERLEPELQSTCVEELNVQVIPIRLQSKLPQTVGFTFPEVCDFLPPPAATADAGESPQPASGSAKNDDANNGDKSQGSGPRKRTRIKPPEDLVKLEDRLYFVLQPPLETLVASARLEFPFPPFPYQFEGIAFLFPRETAILADEMGLGKTMQAITTIRMLLLARQLQNVLLVCPKPLVTNWVREFRTWAPEIPVTVIEGDSVKRNWIWQQHNAPVRIANYELLMRDKAMLDDPNAHFDLVVLDEAQRIKNRNSTTAQIVRALPRGRSWALTGTPIENSVEDLVNIFEFLSPGYLRSDMNLKSIGAATRDHIIRRTKDKVLTEMPPKMFRDEQIELTPAQYDSYRTAEDEGIVQLADMRETLTIQHVFELVLRLKQICNFDPATGASCKLERLEADMEEIAASGQKAIIFSQWVQTLEKIAEPLQRFGPMQYHGRVPSKKRDAVIAQFKEDPSKHLILMSYGAGSVGLNLQFCHYVFLFDRWWNPAIEDQAVNRAHRIGVSAPVTVTRMMAADTIEQRIHDVLEEKRELFNQLFAETGSPQATGLSQEDIFGLFNLAPRPAGKQAA
ncbi:MAG: DEAD/DEAH box helicase, partial [Planctomycetales bacterium]|nr:DEAD/DEAH box helicase [Planctomycetales bacterium]